MVETKLEDTKVTDEQVTVTVTDAKGKTSELSAELLLVATGCGPVTADLGYEDIGVKLDRGFVPKSWDTLETDVEGVYAVGDLAAAVAGPGPRVVRRGHADRRDGRRAALAADRLRRPAGHLLHTEVASVGLTEAQAKEQGTRWW